MEKLREFERSCLRTALNTFRKEDSPKFVSNENLYNLAKIPRIDIFILKLTRDYLSRTKTSHNKIVKQFSETHFDCEERARTGYFPPQYFTHFDNTGLIQDSNNVPIIYHFSRHQSDKTITYTLQDWSNQNNVKYNTRLSIRDRNDKTRLNKKYWWLSVNAVHLDELRRRTRRKTR